MQTLLQLLCLFTLLLLSGCATTRSNDLAVCDNIQPQLATPVQTEIPAEVDVLVLSAGGPWGAFGVGFLDGWSTVLAPPERQRPEFDIAIGISTGAMMVTHAFLGSEHDVVLREQIATLTTRDIYQKRSLFSVLLGDSATDTSPLRRRLERMIPDNIIDQVAEAWIRDGRRLAVIAVDLDCGHPEILDLTAVAVDRRNPKRRERYIDYIMASAASPVAFPPVFIDGHMMVDGALRQHIALPYQIVELLPRNENNATPGVNLFAVINSPLETYPQCVNDHLIFIAIRSSDVWTGERAADSVALTMLDAKRRGWNARYVAPINAPCAPIPQPDDYFEPGFMRCQYEYGYRMATAEASPWHDSIDDLPRPNAVHGKHPCENH